MNNMLMEAILISSALCRDGREQMDVEMAPAAGGWCAGAVSADMVSEKTRNNTNEKREPHFVAQAHSACGARQ